MGQDSKIPWTHHTFNAWRGCDWESPGCANCYAWIWSKRNPKLFGTWGADGVRVAGSEDYWNEPIRWNARAEAAGERQRVFALSMGDWLEDWTGPIAGVQGAPLCRDAQHHWYLDGWGDGRPPGVVPLRLDDVRLRLLDTIRRTPWLDWLLLSKRIQNWRRLVQLALGGVRGDCDRFDATIAWVADWLAGKPPANVWLGVTAENQARADDQLTKLMQVPARIRFGSFEPLLEAVALDGFERGICRACKGAGETYGHYFADDGVGPCEDCRGTCVDDSNPGLDWAIVGGESDQGGRKARPFNVAWARSLRGQCQAAGVAFFMKQMGSNPYRLIYNENSTTDPGDEVPIKLRHHAGEDPDEWPEDLRVRELPAVPAEVA